MQNAPGKRCLHNFRLACLCAAAIANLCPLASAGEQAVNHPEIDSEGWPALSSQTRPWTYWWWMASAVDQTNLTRELLRYQTAGLGGVHIIPIYGAKGYEDKFIEYLSPKWMEMLRYTVAEAGRLGLGVDMTTGSGWCFGGPQVTSDEANAVVVSKAFEITPGARLKESFDPTRLQALAGFSSTGEHVNLKEHVTAEGTLDWSPTNGSWTAYAVSQKPSGQKVKRAGPGGQGPMLNLFYPEAMRHYLQWFDEAFSHYSGQMPRSMYHDSYEYRSDWAPNLFASFRERRGYWLEDELPALFYNARLTNAAIKVDPDHAARVKSDYRETISDVMAEETLPLWVAWARGHGLLTRNEAHGSPGNWLDLYAAADIPETEMFNQDRNKLIAKFASSAAHVSDKRLVSAETGTWLKEHFTETLADMKYLLDDMFLSGVNHVFYHGTCYSPDEAGWPGWLFYASYEMNPRNSIWRDAAALNTYAARCQAFLQRGQPDNDILLYWPIHDLWHNADGLVQPLTVHARAWFEQQPVGKTAAQLWNRGYSFDYISDRQLAAASVHDARIATQGGTYRVVLIPPAQHLPLQTARKIRELAQAGAMVIFQDHLPTDVPGWGNLEMRRRDLRSTFAGVSLKGPSTVGTGQVIVGDLESALEQAKVDCEKMFDFGGIMCIRRRFEDGCCYFIANRSAGESLDRWVPLTFNAQSIEILDPLTGRTGAATLRKSEDNTSEAYVRLGPGESLLLRCWTTSKTIKEPFQFWRPSGPTTQIGPEWDVEFIEGGPERPKAYKTKTLGSWTEAPDSAARNFAGTARYTARFDAPATQIDRWEIDLGKVSQSARVRLNGQALGTLFAPPFRVLPVKLKPAGNVLELEVTSVSANRVSDLDRRGVKWKNFYDINFVGMDYKPFNASAWALTDAGLLGPVTVTPVTPTAANSR